MTGKSLKKAAQRRARGMQMSFSSGLSMAQRDFPGMNVTSGQCRYKPSCSHPSSTGSRGCSEVTPLAALLMTGNKNGDSACAT